MKRLGVNIDHIATVRNARGELYPSPLRAALLAEKNNAKVRFHAMQSIMFFGGLTLLSFVPVIGWIRLVAY